MIQNRNRAEATSCPNCGTNASGNFCPSCGATLAGAKCHKCGTAAVAGARFCHHCSARLGSAGIGLGSSVAWVAAAAVAVVAVIAAAIILVPSAPPPAAAFPSLPAPQTPRAVADENFNQSMMAHERGDNGAAASYGQMALDGYAALGRLDNDLRLHVGLINVVMNNLEGALAQADSLEQAVPGHLYATILRHRVYEIRGDSSGMLEAYARFLQYHQQEVNAGRPEYNEHMRMLDNFLEAAASAVRNR